MKINQIDIVNYLKVSKVHLQLEKPATVIAGGNAQGKSSIAEAIRHCLVGTPTRINLKKDFKNLVRHGEKTGSVVIEHDQGASSLIIPKGEAEGVINHAALDFVLRPDLFSGLDAAEKRKFLMKLTGVKITSQEIVKRLIAKGVNEDKAQEVIPLLSSGLSLAQKEAADKAREAKGAWRNITGETYGTAKADQWKHEHFGMVIPDDAEIQQTKEQIAEQDKQIELANKAIGKLSASEVVDVEALKARIAEEREIAKQYAATKDKLFAAEDAVKQWEAKVEKATVAATGKREGLVHDLAFALDDARKTFETDGKYDEVLERYEQAHDKLDLQHDDALADKLESFEAGLGEAEQQLDSLKRQLAKQDAAANMVAELEDRIKSASTEDNRKELGKLESKLELAKSQKRQLENWLSEVESEMKGAEEAKHKTIKAMEEHTNVMEWLKISEQLSPSGIPSEFNAEVLDRTNHAITQFINPDVWGEVRVNDEFELTCNGYPYPVLAESQKWRVDFLFACAAANLSGLKLVMADRFDVLDPANRGCAARLVMEATKQGLLDTVILIGTFKEKPKMPASEFNVFWVENGTI